MTERLRQAMAHIDEVPEVIQNELADRIEAQIAPITVLPSYAGSMPDLPDDFEEELMRRRHEALPTPAMDEQLLELLEDESA